MNYKSFTIKKAMQMISQNEVYLPAIQRKFVWGPDKIELLFDSIMRGYPIGTFLFWIVEAAAKEEYTFYKFIQDYHERDNPWNEVAPKPVLTQMSIGVLDGQQRLNSMYVALQGSYAYKNKYGRWENDAAFPKRQLYINLFYVPAEENDGGVEYEFSFLTEEESKRLGPANFWFRVKDVVGWEGLPQLLTAVSKAATAHPTHATQLLDIGVQILSKLWQKLCTEDLVNYFSIQDQEMDRITDIFIRVNSTGLVLSKTDLLFSSIVAHWDEGRANIESAIESLNRKGGGFWFNNDFVMRSCLVLTDIAVRLKVNSFKRENIQRIRDCWPKIERALDRAVDLLVEWGICGGTLQSANAVIIMAYFVFKEGNVGASKASLQQYLVRSQIKQVFGSRSDQILTKLRDALRESSEPKESFQLRSSVFDLNALIALDLPNGASLRVTQEAIDDLMTTSKSPYSFLVLSMLYSQLRFNEIQFHQDHIHPHSQFSADKLEALGCNPDQVAEWQALRDQLPNLQLMEGSQNQSKNNTEFDVWLDRQLNRQHFMQANYIPENQDLKLSNFLAFFQARKVLLQQRLRVIFQVEAESSPEVKQGI